MTVTAFDDGARTGRKRHLESHGSAWRVGYGGGNAGKTSAAREKRVGVERWNLVMLIFSKGRDSGAEGMVEPDDLLPEIGCVQRTSD